MKIEKPKQSERSKREIESYHFSQGPSGEIDMEFFKANESALNMAKELLIIREAKLTIYVDSENLTRALVKNNKGEIIFSTTLSNEIEDLANIAYNKPH